MMLLYGSEGNGPKIQVLVQDETIWLSQKQMAELFEVSTVGWGAKSGLGNPGA
jgi:hypothetical protein